MDPENKQDHLFDIKLDETGVFYIKKMFRLTGVILIFMVITSFLSIFREIQFLDRSLNRPARDIWQAMRIHIYPFLSIGSVIINIVSVYYYIKFIRQLNRNIDINDQASFNRSFAYGYRNTIIFLCLMITSFMLHILLLITTLKSPY